MKPSLGRVLNYKIGAKYVITGDWKSTLRLLSQWFISLHCRRSFALASSIYLTKIKAVVLHRMSAWKRCTFWLKGHLMTSFVLYSTSMMWMVSKMYFFFFKAWLCVELKNILQTLHCIFYILLLIRFVNQIAGLGKTALYLLMHCVSINDAGLEKDCIVSYDMHCV